MELAALIARGDASSAEVVVAHVERIERVNPALNAVVIKRYDQARAEAREADLDPRLRTLLAVAKMAGPARVAASRLLKAVGQPTMGRFLEHFGHTHVSQYWDLVEAQMDYRSRFAEALDRDGIDVIVCPACALPAYTHGASNDLGVMRAIEQVAILRHDFRGEVPM